jgi:hypothetical protein
MNRGDLGLFALFPLAAYATWVAAQSVSGLDAAAALGLLASVLPLIGFARRDIAFLAWVPGVFLGLTVYLTSGVSVNDFPGFFGDLLGGWALGAPVFLAIGALYAKESPGTRIFLIVLVLLASAASLSAAALGPYGTSDAFGLVFAQVPRMQAEALGVVLTGGAPAVLPMFRGVGAWFLPLGLLAGAGGLVGLLAVDPSAPPEALGFDQVDPHIPEGMFRSLFPEGRSRLTEATPVEHPPSADLPSVASLVVAVAVALVALYLATVDPDQLLPFTAGTVIALLAASLALSYASRNPRRAVPTAPTDRAAAPVDSAGAEPL